jgi:hypothetical protein
MSKKLHKFHSHGTFEIDLIAREPWQAECLALKLLPYNTWMYEDTNVDGFMELEKADEDGTYKKYRVYGNFVLDMVAKVKNNVDDEIQASEAQAIISRKIKEKKFTVEFYNTRKDKQEDDE